MRIRGIHMTGDVEKSLKYRESQCLGCFSLKIDNPQCSSRPHTKTSVQYRQVCYFRKTGTTRARFPVCDCFSNVCLTHMDGTENHSRNDLIPLVRLRIRCDHSRNRMSTQDTYLRNANQVCKARKPRSYCSLMFEHFMVDCSALLKQVPNSFGFETCYGWRPFARLVVAGCHPDTA